MPHLKVVPVTVGRMESQTQNTLPVPPLGKPVRVLQTKHTLVNIVKSYGRVQQSNDKDKI